MSEWQFDELEDEAVEVKSCRPPLVKLVLRGLLLSVAIFMVIRGNIAVYQGPTGFMDSGLFIFLCALVAMIFDLLLAIWVLIGSIMLACWVFGDKTWDEFWNETTEDTGVR